jgi:nucleoside-diphosphate-sugar epimerase
MCMKALITGAAGFIGSHLAEECLEQGWDVVGVDSLTTYYSPTAKVRNVAALREHPRCRLLEQDVLDLDLTALLADVDVVFHLAAQAGVRASWGQSFDVYTQLNVTVLQRLLEAARGADLDRFVFASSSSVYGDAETFPTTEDTTPRPLSPYGATKALGESLVYLYFRNYGVPATSLRYFSVYGPRQRPDMAFHRSIEAALDDREFVVFGDGAQTRDFTYVDDIVAGTIAAGRRGVPGAVYNLGRAPRQALARAARRRSRHRGGHHPGGGGPRLRAALHHRRRPGRAGRLAPQFARVRLAPRWHGRHAGDGSDLVESRRDMT